VLKDENGYLMENIWQFSKIYRDVPESTQRYSRYDPTVIWSHPAEVHVDAEDNPNELYWKWREKGMKAPHPIRYPVGIKHRHTCIGTLIKTKDGWKKLDYVEGRRQIYLPTFLNLVRKQPQYKQLVKMLQEGKNLLIIEVDGPHQESLDYYREKYGVDADFIQDSTMLATFPNLNIMLNDVKHSFGHGYCLAWALLETQRQQTQPSAVKRIV